ncbi:hypothetical protein [Streptomyces sp. NPDC018031]|uniref:hypothetical protein n=1 Tax=Streptomyces sp. NPDC018031 TaxID=3365033 RepID=UPI0037B52164
MSLVQHHMLDAYRAARHGEPAPPAPATGDWHPIRAYREWRRFRSVTAGITGGADRRTAGTPDRGRTGPPDDGEGEGDGGGRRVRPDSRRPEPPRSRAC